MDPRTAGTRTAGTQPTPVWETIDVDDGCLTTARWGSGPPEIVLLHDGLGSIDQWRTIPGDLAVRTGRTVLAYDRPGHGSSTPHPSGPWPADWLHVEADRLSHLIDALHLGRDGLPLLLVGHSDGGSIALLYAATESRPASGIITLAAHTWVEQQCVDAIVEMRAAAGPIVAGLAKSHAEPTAIFDAWSGAWVSDEFRGWDIRPRLNSIRQPTLIAQGGNDEYATPAHVDETVAAIGENATGLLLPTVGHLLHHQDPGLVVDTIATFDRSLHDTAG